MHKDTLPVGVITVTYNPDLIKLESQLAGLSAAQVVIFVDNGSNEETQVKISALISTYSNLTVKLLDHNYGIARAQNIGVELVLERVQSLKYLLFLDHDSVPAQGCIKSLFDMGELLNRNHRLGIIGPKLIDPRTKLEYGVHKFRGLTISRVRSEDNDSKIVECDQINSSGSFVPVGTWRKVGKFREEFFIDHVETDWCFRARKKGLELYGIFNATIEHEMGDDNCDYWLLGKRSMPYRSPLRHYYIVRNSFFLQRQAYVPIRWKMLNVVKLIFTFFYFGLLSSEKADHRRNMLQGITDGLRGKMGKKM